MKKVLTKEVKGIYSQQVEYNTKRSYKPNQILKIVLLIQRLVLGEVYLKLRGL